MFEVGENAIARIYLVTSPDVMRLRFCRILEIGKNKTSYRVNIQTDRGKWKIDNVFFYFHCGWIPDEFLYKPS